VWLGVGGVSLMGPLLLVFYGYVTVGSISAAVILILLFSFCV
jgi:hypothetical protein